MRSAMENDMHVLGSCWGLQIAAAATGGTVSKSPRGREVGIARKIAGDASRRRGMHFMPISRMFFDSPCIHYDEVTHLPSGSVILAENAHSSVQAAVIRVGGQCVLGGAIPPRVRRTPLGEPVSALWQRYDLAGLLYRQ